uniref:Uncharacterized protein n=1 Tax=Rhizophora mucronata TaxID=61149 RepID=A0A2P2P591_RHIMU
MLYIFHLECQWLIKGVDLLGTKQRTKTAFFIIFNFMIYYLSSVWQLKVEYSVSHTNRATFNTSKELTIQKNDLPSQMTGS